MRIEMENGTAIESPTADHIRQTIEALDADGNTYAILTARPLTYMQTIVCEGGMELEFQEGDTDQHFQASRLLERGDVIWAMQQYASGDEAWRTEFEWNHLDLAAASGSGCASVIFWVLSTSGALMWLS